MGEQQEYAEAALKARLEARKRMRSEKQKSDAMKKQLNQLSDKKNELVLGESAGAVSAITTGGQQLSAEQVAEQEKQDAEEEERLAQKLNEQAQEKIRLDKEFKEQEAE